MNLLLDNHAFIWYIEGNSKLQKKTYQLIDNPKINIFLSIASLWEISIKLNLKKIMLLINYEQLDELIQQLSIKILPITFTDTLINLNLENFHKDPFDRIIISQAISNNFALISNDSIFDLYSINRIW